MSETIGFIGLGQLGLPMATNLLDSGYNLRVYNRTASKAAPLAAVGAEVVARPVDAVTNGGIVVTVLWDDASVESIVTSEGFLEKLGPNGIHISMSTISPEMSKKLAALHKEHGSSYVEAPVFGRPEAAAVRGLWIPLVGPETAKERARPILIALGGKGIFDFGEEAGAAVTVKILGNFLIISASRSLGEALTMAKKNNVDPNAVLEMLTQTLFPAPIYQSYGKRIVENNVPFSQNAIPIKDVGLFINTAQKVDAPSIIAEMLLETLKSS